MTLRKFLIVLLCAALAGCGGLAGEPRIVSTLPPATPVPTDVGHPLTPPDVAQGATIYADNCVKCHGADGKGNGDLVQSGQVQAPPDFTNAATSSSQRPDEWFNTITVGNTAALMPPWGDALSEEQRWDVAMYTYTLADPPALIAHGHDVFTANCVECHGTSGKGDGPKANQVKTIPANLTDLKEMATLSRDLIYKTVTDGTGNDMPAFATKLSDADRHAVVAYVRTLALANADKIGASAPSTETANGQAVQPPVATQEVAAVQPPIATEEAASTEAVTLKSVTVTGKTTNGTAGGIVPSDLKITLFVFDANLQQKQYSANANADGSFSFANVPLDLNSTYVTTTNYRNQVFASTLLTGDALKSDAADGTLNLPISIYELTEDSDVIQIAGLVTQVTVAGDGMQVAQIFNFTNTSDRAFITTKTASNGEPISLAITLPPGAVVAGLSNNQNRYVIDQANFTVFDTEQVLPKEQHIVQLAYLIPYDKGGAIIEQPLNYALSGAVRLLLSPATIQVTSKQLPPLGAQSVGNSTYQAYGGQLALGAGDVLSYTLSGTGLDVSANGTVETTVVSSNNLLLVGVGVLVLLGLLGGGLFVISARNRSGDQQVINILVSQIAELDADHDGGKIADDAYERQRSALKARLASLMERKK